MASPKRPELNPSHRAMTYPHHAACVSLPTSAGLIIAALVYIRGWLRVRRPDSKYSVGAWRVISFLLGLFLIWTAIGSPVARLDYTLLTAHMIKHLLLMTLAPPLILLGTPLRPLLLGTPQRILHVCGLLFRSSPVQQLAKDLTHPAICWLGATGALVAWHVPDLFVLGLRSEMWHWIEQASFFATGLLFWWPVVHPLSIATKWSQWSVLLYLFLATLPCDILSAFLVFCDRVVYPVFLSSPQSFGLSAVEDQQCAGALMWTCVTVIYLVAGTLITARLLSPKSSPEWSVRQSGPPGVSISTTVRQDVEVA
jgi:putative membrane protein